MPTAYATDGIGVRLRCGKDAEKINIAIAATIVPPKNIMRFFAALFH